MSTQASITVSYILRNVAAFVDLLDGDVTHKPPPTPKKNPPRKKSIVKNKSNRSDYSKHYMREYREDGKDYQKMPENLKELRREQKKQLKSL